MNKFLIFKMIAYEQIRDMFDIMLKTYNILRQFSYSI